MDYTLCQASRRICGISICTTQDFSTARLGRPSNSKVFGSSLIQQVWCDLRQLSHHLIDSQYRPWKQRTIGLKHKCTTASLGHVQLADYPDQAQLCFELGPKTKNSQAILLFRRLLHLRHSCKHVHITTCRAIYTDEIAFSLWPWYIDAFKVPSHFFHVLHSPTIPVRVPLPHWQS